MVGDRMMKLAVLMIPDQTRTHVPPLTSPAPISPPISACEELLGSPSHQVMQVPADRGEERAQEHLIVDDDGVDDPHSDGLGHGSCRR